MFCGLFHAQNTMVMVFLQSESIWVSLATRAGQDHVKKIQFLKCLILKNKDQFLMQNVPGNPMVSFVCTWSRTPKNHVLLYDVIIRRHVVGRKLAF